MSSETLDPRLREMVRADPTLPTRAIAELERRIELALEGDDGEPYSDALTALAKRMAHGEQGRNVLIELSVIGRGSGGARDIVEAISLISYVRGEVPDLPVSLARAIRERLTTMTGKPET